MGVILDLMIYRSFIFAILPIVEFYAMFFMMGVHIGIYEVSHFDIGYSE